MNRKANLTIVIIGFLLITTGCVNVFKLSDLREEGYTFPNNQNKAKQLMKEMGIAHKIDMWDSIQTYNILLNEESFGFLGKKSSPFKELNMEFSLNYIPKTFNGQLKILSGKEKDVTWGIHSGKTYKREKDIAIAEENKHMKFSIPTFQYFIEFPSRIQEASVIDYIGEKTINGIKTEGVIASWNTTDPQKDIDQYVIWINSENKRIVRIDYTIREKFKFVSGSAYCKNYKNFDGFILPLEINSKSNLQKEGFLHKKKIKGFRPNVVSKAYLTPLN